MANKTLNAKIKQRIDTTANWNSNSNIILENGELGFERTASGEIKAKIGNGNDSWENLPYIFESTESPGISYTTVPNQYGTTIILEE